MQLCRAIGQPTSETRIDLLVQDRAAETQARRELAGLDVKFHQLPFGDIWLRDTAPIFVHDGQGRVQSCSFAFNGWGEKFVYPGDAELSELLANRLPTPGRRFDTVLEGGAVEVDGQGLGITTRSCILDSNRGANRSEARLQELLHEALGIEDLIWLDQGLDHDHTDGHIDNAARFVAPGRILHSVALDSDDPQGPALTNITKDLRAARTHRASTLELVELPSPGRIVNERGEVLPASYLNFYIANHCVAVPVYGSRHDQQALDRIGDCFPERCVVPIETRALLEEGGALHCITQPQPGPIESLKKECRT